MSAIRCLSRHRSLRQLEVQYGGYARGYPVHGTRFRATTRYDKQLRLLGRALFVNRGFFSLNTLVLDTVHDILLV